MMFDFRGDGGSEMTPKNRTLEGRNGTLGGDGGSKIVINRKLIWGINICWPSNLIQIYLSKERGILNKYLLPRLSKSLQASFA